VRNERGVENLSEENAAQLKAFEGTLSEQAFFLAPLAETLASRWSEIYLNTFGRGSFFSSQRVEKIFKELTEIFIHCLKERCLDIYFENLKERGCVFSRLGVPFEEVIISLHLFEEVCLEQFLESYPNRSKLPKLILAMEELHSEGLAVLATSYFETTKKEMQRITESLKEENDALRNELTQTQESLFAHTAKDLTSMQLMVSSINHKLRHRVYQLSRIQKMAEALDAESNLPKLLAIASQQFESVCPAGSAVYFGFFDEERRKTNVYHRTSRQDTPCDIVQTFYFSELPAAFQDTLYDEAKKAAHFKGYADIPQALLKLMTARNLREFVLLPVRRYQEAAGFIFLASPTDDFFSKNNLKFFQRLGQVASKAVVSALLFTRSRKQDEFTSLLDELARKSHDQKNTETLLDFCLGSLIDLLGVERASLMRYDEDKKELKVCAAKGYKVYPISGVSIKWGEGVAGLALKESKIISIANMKEPARSHMLAQALKRKEAPEAKLKSLLCLPLSELEKPLGVVNVSTINFHKHFEKSEIDMAHQVVNRLADIVKNL